MANNDYETEWDGNRFPREKNTGVVMGLDLVQVIFLVSVLAIAVAMIFIMGFPRGLFLGVFFALAGGAVGFIRFWGRSLIGWLWESIMFVFRGAAGQLRYKRELPVVATSNERDEWDTDAESRPGRDKHGRINPGKGHRLALPGEHAEMKVYDLPGGAGFIFDPKRKEGMIVARLETRRAFRLESDEAMEDRTRGFRDSITALAGIQGVSRVQLSDQTTMISGFRVKSWYEEKSAEAPRVPAPAGTGTVPLSGANVNPWLHNSYLDLIEDAQDQPIHKMWITIVLDATTLERRALAAGGGLRGFMEVSQKTMGNIEEIVKISGVQVTGWHTARSVAALARSAFDPDATLEISDREGDWAGAHPESAGPAGAEVFPRHLWSDGWYHRTYMISEWPQAQAHLGFLEELVFCGEFRHTVTVVFKSKDLRGALRKTQNRKSDWQTAEKIRRKVGRPPSLEHEHEQYDIEQEERELMASHAAVDLIALITVSGADEEQLESHSADLKSKAAQANCEVRPANLQQDSAFVAAALPFGRAILT